jgi:hexosaminidase
MKKLSIIGFFICITLQLFAQVNIIPQPRKLEVHEGINHFDQLVVLSTQPESQPEANYLSEFLQANLKAPVFKLNKGGKPDPAKKLGIVQLSIIQSDTILPDGWYNLISSPEGIKITALSRTGLFYGIQSLIQVVDYENDVFSVPSFSIAEDYPGFAWRGMHLDVCRHFFSVDFVKRYIDLIAAHKMNRFHWHLTEDQGWRIEIKKYPKLTEIGAWRNGSMIGKYRDNVVDSIRYGGFYTQDEIREVVAYAADRHITIVPEIEMPGHALAALAAYPEFSCTGGPFEVAKTWGVFDDVYCPKEETFTFLEGVLDEVCQLFPGEYIHIGGDECPKTRWKTCVSCQKRMKDEGLKDEHELQSYFIQRIEKYLNSKGKKIIGWDEILEGGLAPNAAVMSWRGEKGGIAAAKQSHFVVMSPSSHCYFDHYQGDNLEEPLAIGGFTPLEKVYSYKPIPDSLDNFERFYILGAQANLWTEYITTEAHAEYMVLPRMSALSEMLWSDENSRDYEDFTKRLRPFLKSLEKRGYHYRPLD